ncbi:hypothetical protein RB597_001111 [Gaeumannomyces tritici]
MKGYLVSFGITAFLGTGRGRSLLQNLSCELCTKMFPAGFAVTLLSILQHAHAQLNTITTPSLNVTAIGAADGASTIECWQFGPFVSSSVPGVAGALGLFLGSASNATFTVIPARFDGGLHNAPVPQFVYFTSGLVHITLPGSADDAWIHGGKYGLIVAADTRDVSALGHRTEYPSAADTVALQVPIAEGSTFEHRLLHRGACTAMEMSGF